MEPFWPYDPNQPPPSQVTIPLEMWDSLRKSLGELMDAHNLIRGLVPLVRGNPACPSWILRDIEHFEREYFPVDLVPPTSHPSELPQ
jgi:hypothetical protein